MPGKQNRIFLHFPTCYGNNAPAAFNAMYRAIGTSRSCEVLLHCTQGDALLSRVRNHAISAFLDSSGFSHFACLDSDIEVVDCTGDSNWLDKLCTWNLPFVGGLYAIKSDEDCRTSSVVLDPENGPPRFGGWLREMRYLSTGLWLLQRGCVETMARSYPELWYDEDAGGPRRIFGGFIPFVEEMGAAAGRPEGRRKYLSEDWAWCRRWRHIGGRIYADCSIRTIHHGSKPYPVWRQGSR
jgi:hypothetical protein